MIFVSQEGDIINSQPNDTYFQEVKEFILEWQGGVEYLTVNTSGSTGTPKAISLSRKQILASVHQSQKAFSLNEESFFLCNLSVHFIAGKLMIIRALELRAELLIVKPDGNLIDNLGSFGYMIDQKRGRCFMAFVPLQLQNLLEDSRGYNLLAMAGSIIIGGAAVSAQLEKQIKEISSPVYATFGMTETITHFAIKRLNGDQPDDYFRVLQGTKIKLEEGKLCVKNECTNQNWLITNDLAEIVNNDQFLLKGRADRVINSGGVKLHLDEIEQKIDKILKLKIPFFCIGLPDSKLGEKLVLFIESGQKDPTIISTLKSKMAKFEAPKEVIFLKEFKLTITGKTDKIKTAHAYSVSDE
ncbi:AMP-binding protein [Jiulongibacter sediminis]|jgi:O-succinylbenzoic acid--CoA ligase|uniref:AMP-binding protein n=1 Tax=Jiulongibacter sediminis TaxID=1605367 RepID=UPI0026ECCC17|nr:AMP-binding protein [Jiulongibacter sediminis]